MSTMVYDVRELGMVRPRLPRSARQIRSMRNLSLEQVARLAPAWGHVEVRHAGADRPWNVRGV